MPITTKTAAALIAIFVALFAGAWIILDQAVRPGFERLEAQSQQRDEARVRANLAGVAADLSERVLDYARWDAATNYFLGRNPGFVRTNFYPNWYGEYGVDLVVLADDDGHVLYSNDPVAARRAIAQARGRVHGADSITGVIWTDGGPMQLAAAHASGNEGHRAPLGYVILGRRLSADALKSEVQVDLQFVNVRTADRDVVTRLSALSSGRAQTWVDGHSRRALIPLTGIDGRVIGAVATRHARDISALGVQTSALALGLFALMSAIALGLLWFLLRTLVIRRIEVLGRHLDAQTNATELQPLQTESDSKDEISRLTEAYNALALRLRDSTEREQRAVLERQAAATANKMKSDFLANVSYELRTPLNAVIGYAELIEEELVDAGFQRANSDLKRITAAARRLLSLINEILDLSKLEVGRLEITPEAFKVDEMLQSAISAVQPVAEKEHTRLDLDLGADLGVAYSDQQRLRQCLINVLSNACRFAPQGAVSFRARRDGDVLRFEVRDNGVAMTADQLARAFEPFAEADATIARRFGGTGLGLAMTKKLMILLGGEIQATSGAARGTTFVLRAPAMIEETRREPADETSISAAA